MKPLKQQSNDYRIYSEFVKRIVPPEDSNKFVWGDPVESKMALCIVELDEHPLLPHVLFNACHVYGGCPDISLYIFHGSNNRDYIIDIINTHSFENVVMYDMKTDTLSPGDYHRILKHTSFWLQIAPDYVFIFNVYTLFRKSVPFNWFHSETSFYDFVAAPYSHLPYRGVNRWRRVGNGLCSYRNKRTLVQITLANPRAAFDVSPEDIFFADRMNDNQVAPYELATMFCVESIIHPDPMCCLNIWKYMTPEFMIHLIETTPGYSLKERSS